MQTNNKLNNPTHGINSAIALNSTETKQILTPFAFEIDKTLFGLPLSVPWKRGAALIIDFLIITLLATTPGELLALLVAITFFLLGSKRRAAKLGKKRGIRMLLMRLLGLFIMFVVIVSTVPDLVDDWSAEEAETTQLSQEENDPTILSAQQNDKNEESKTPTEPNHSILEQGIKWGVGVIKDLGLSFGWAAFYFTVLTAIWNGQTPGKKLLRIRVIQLDGTPLSVWDSFGRYGGYGAGLATGFMGFLQIYWDPNRQAIHDKISSTVVIDLKKLAKNA